jgi:uncharacterized RDD family membrane protein YckC
LNTSRTSTLVIRTPEGVIFSQFLAGPMSRCLAWLIDLGVILLLQTVLGLIFAALSMVGGDAVRAANLLLYFVLSLGYGMVLEWIWGGQTIGKRLLRLRVMDVHGLRLQFSQIAMRNLLRAVDMLPLLYLVGGLACLLNKRSQRLGDLAANTVVIRHPKVSEPNLDQLLAGKYNSLRAYPHLEARLRQRVSAAEAAVALQAIARRELLDAEARVALFAEIGERFRSKVEFPLEATDGITDEQYVRNVVDVLYRSRGQAGAPLEPTRQAAAAS